MIAKLIETLGAFVIWGISATGYLGIVLMMAIESACIPLPSEIIMPFSGYLVYTGRFSSLWMVATLGAIGCNVGSVLAYEIGYYGGRPLVERWGRYILLNMHDLDMSERFFAKYGDVTVFVARLLPVVRTFIALPAGIARMPRVRFHVYTFLGSWPWCYMLAYVGLKLGESWNTNPALKTWFHRFDAVIGGILILGVIWFVWSHWQHRARAANVKEKDMVTER
ncbi:MAG TPA: DedA family protein [Clostridia bacterium]|nr:DedA family protein [Clostridia bacterium]